MTVEGRTHKPIVNRDLCQRCSVCIRECPAEYLPDLRHDEDTVRGYVYTQTDVPIKEILPPCVGSCPLGQQVRDYVQLLAAGKAKEALLVIREDNPLPGVCGYVCHHPCEQACVRGSWDDPVSIRELKRYAIHYEIDHQKEIVAVLKEYKKPAQGKKVGIVGAGPAGLACAFELALEGYAITVMDALNQPGGMLVGAIPPFRLPRYIINHDIDIIRSLGVKFIPSMRIGESELKRKEFDAFVLATGTWKDKALDIRGEDTPGCMKCLDFLNTVNEGESINLSGTVVVIGGGNAAVDAARTAVRIKSEQVIILYRRSSQEMPASREEVKAALNEGVQIQYLVAPNRIISKADKIQGVECTRMELGEQDETGRKMPIPISGSEFFQAADFVIPAIGQRSEISFLRAGSISDSGTIKCDKDGRVKGYEDVFAAGDAVTGPSTIVEAIASGKAIARSVMRHLEERE